MSGLLGAVSSIVKELEQVKLHSLHKIVAMHVLHDIVSSFEVKADDNKVYAKGSVDVEKHSFTMRQQFKLRSNGRIVVYEFVFRFVELGHKYRLADSDLTYLGIHGFDSNMVGMLIEEGFPLQLGGVFTFNATSNGEPYFEVEYVGTLESCCKSLKTSL